MRSGIGVIRVLCVGVASFVLTSPLQAESPEVVALIDQLVSPNPEPITKQLPGEYETPEGFDAIKQERVYEARRKLVELGPKAFPDLLERREDKRYCLTTEDGLSGCCHNRTVGDVCKMIIFDQLQPYGFFARGVPKRLLDPADPFAGDDPRSVPRRPGYPSHFLGSAKEAKVWWEKHKDQSLHAMQLEAVEWILAEEAKKAEDFSDEERAYLQEIRDTLVQSGKALKSGSYYSNDREFRVQFSEPSKRKGK